MNTHIKVLGLLYLIWGGLGLLAVVAVLVIFGATGVIASFEDPGAGVALGIIGSIAVIITLVVSLPNLLAGWGLIAYKPWSRILTIILSIIHLFGFPLGTALGIYGLWVLFQPEAIRMLEQSGYRGPGAGHSSG